MAVPSYPYASGTRYGLSPSAWSQHAIRPTIALCSKSSISLSGRMKICPIAPPRWLRSAHGDGDALDAVHLVALEIPEWRHWLREPALVGGSGEQPRRAGLGVPAVSEPAPGEPAAAGDDLRFVPGRSTVRADVDASDPTEAGPRVAGQLPRSGNQLGSIDRGGDQRLDRHLAHGLNRLARLGVEGVVVGVVVAVERHRLREQPGQPLRRRDPCPAGYKQAHGTAVLRQQRRAVHLPDEHRVRVAGDRERKSTLHAVEVGALGHDIDGAAFNAGEVEH